MGRARLFFPPTQQPWLCFESAETRRRLSPVPSDWVTRPDAELETMCEHAQAQSGMLNR
jgi:hypothetical protein